MKYLITGGEGFIGSYLKERLLSDGAEVKTLDISGSPDFNTSILDYESLASALQGVDGVFHLAAVTSPPQFEEDLLSGFNTNVIGTLNVLRACHKNGVKRAVLASSSAVYGDISIAGVESDHITGHKNMYATTKLIDEYLGRFFHLRNEIETVFLRYFNVYGVGENCKGIYSSVFTHFLKSIAEGEKPLVYGDGTQSRDFVYVKDVADGSIAAMEYGKSGETYNIGTGTSISFNKIIETISKVIGRTVLPKYISNPFSNYQNFTLAEISKSKRDLHWHPRYNITMGIGELAESYGLI